VFCFSFDSIFFFFYFFLSLRQNKLQKKEIKQKKKSREKPKTSKTWRGEIFCFSSKLVYPELTAK